MRIRMRVGVLVSCFMILVGEVNAQTTSAKTSDQTILGDVTFEVPLNLTRLSPYMTKVAVTCAFGDDPKRLTTVSTCGTMSSCSEVLFNRVEFPVSAGQVVTTARVVIAMPSYPLFKPGTVLNYQCVLSALSSAPGAGSSWYPLDQKVPVASLQVSPVPVPITGTFAW